MTRDDWTLAELKAENALRTELERFQAFRRCLQAGKNSEAKRWADDLGLNPKQLQFARMVVDAVEDFFLRQKDAEVAEASLKKASGELEAFRSEVQARGYESEEDITRFDALQCEHRRLFAASQAENSWGADPRRSAPELFALEQGGDFWQSYASQSATGTHFGNYLIEQGCNLVAGATWRHLGRPQPEARPSIWIERDGDQFTETSFMPGGRFLKEQEAKR